LTVAVEKGMGLLERIRRSLHRMAESDEQRLAEEIQGWAATIPGTTRIADAPIRSRAKIAGVVRRITVRPVEGYESLEALISDGTGEVEVVWMGRRSIPGLSLGTHVVVDGVLGEQRGQVRMVNPTFEFSR
jgi:RecG-like helicase